MASYRQPENTYPYFCQRGPSSDTTTNINGISTSSTFWANGNLERGLQSSISLTNGLVFTAPVKGLYYFKIILNCLNNGSINNDSGSWGITITRASPLNNSERYITDNPGNIATTTTEYNTQFSTIAFLNEGDTVKMGATDFVDLETYLANRCYFMGYLIAGFA